MFSAPGSSASPIISTEDSESAYSSTYTDYDDTYYTDDEDSSVQTPSVGSFSVKTPTLQSMNSMTTEVRKMNGSLVGVDSKEGESTVVSQTKAASKFGGLEDEIVSSNKNASVENQDDDTLDNERFIEKYKNECKDIVRKRSVGLASVMSRKQSHSPQSVGDKVQLNISPSVCSKTVRTKPPISPQAAVPVTKRQASVSKNSTPSSSTRSSSFSMKPPISPRKFNTRSTKFVTPQRGRTSSNDSITRLSSRFRSRSKSESKQCKNRSSSCHSRKSIISVSKSRSQSSDSKGGKSGKRKKKLSLFSSSKSSVGYEDMDDETLATTDDMMESRVEEEEVVIVTDDASLGLSLDSTAASPTSPLGKYIGQTPVVTYGNGLMRFMGKGPKGMLNMSVSKKDLRLRQQAEKYLKNQDYNALATIVKENPKIVGIQASQALGRTLLHVIADESNPIPENILLKIISHDTSVVAVPDSSTNVPLHYATNRLRLENFHVFVILLKFHPGGASDKNNEGDLPIHIAASNPNKGTHEAIHLLLETNPGGITQPNKMGKIPLHYALSDGAENLENTRSIVHFHKHRKTGVSVLDNKGHSPLHTAIMSGTSYRSIQSFNDIARDSFVQAYTKEDEEGHLPLHTALMKNNVDPLILLSLIHAAPFTGGMPTPEGDMPIALATKHDMNPTIIKTLLAADLPVELGNKQGTTSGMGSLVLRDHGHSWWHVAVECQGKYVDTIYSLLADKANFIQIIALARSIGPDNKTMTIHAASAYFEASIRNLLRFYYRYELLANRVPIISTEVQSFSAIDHGEELQRMEITGPWLQDGFTAVEGSERWGASENDHEVSYSPWQTKQKAVTLRCYSYDDAYEAELLIRKKHDLSSDFVERIIYDHRVLNYVNASFNTGKLLCIAYERNDITLCELLQGNNPNQRNWIVKCHRVLSDIAHALQYIHDKCLSHGRLDSSAVAKFLSKWKLLDIGSATEMGNAMNGVLRRSIPPEAVVKTRDKISGETFTKKKARGRKTSGKGSGISESSTKKSTDCSVAMPPTRKKFGVFVFNMNELGLHQYGSKPNDKKPRLSDNASIGDDLNDDFTANTDEGSLRIIAMQEDEIARLRVALDEKEHVYRRQLAEERATFKMQEIKRVRDSKEKDAGKKYKIVDEVRFVPEKVMASPSWDIWGLGLIMAELLLGKSVLLPCNQDSDAEFLDELAEFDEIKVIAISEEVRDVAGDLAADLIMRLLHPKPQQRIGSIYKVLHHKYFHEAVEISADAPSGKKRKKAKRKSQKVTGKA